MTVDSYSPLKLLSGMDPLDLLSGSGSRGRMPSGIFRMEEKSRERIRCSRAVIAIKIESIGLIP